MSNRIIRRSNIGLVASVLFLGGAGSLLAQDMVQVGDTVRLDHVHVGASLLLTHKDGIFAGRQGDTVLVRRGDQTLRLRLTNLSEARIRKGSEGSPGTGIVFGLLASTLAEVIWVASDSPEAAGCQKETLGSMQKWVNCDRPVHGFNASVIVAGAAGGMALGFALKRPHWVKAILPGKWRS